jgi:phosphoribosylaminoimidazole-succinocarboxamide synthase
MGVTDISAGELDSRELNAQAVADEILKGKSKTVHKGPTDETLVMRYRDSVTALNGEKKEELAGKGKLNCAISNLIFAYLEKNGIKTHLIEAVDETSVLVRNAQIFMVEVIVRNVAAGSFSKKYGAEEGSALKNAVVEFSLKSDKLGDPMINESQITALGLAAKEELAQISARALKINGLLKTLFTRAGITIADFKLEFGKANGEIILCDEISPDSCRLWDTNTGKKLDKDRFRRDLGDVVESYGEVLARLLETKLD